MEVKIDIFEKIPNFSVRTTSSRSLRRGMTNFVSIHGFFTSQKIHIIKIAI